MACAVERKLPFLIVQLPQWINGKTAADGNDPMRWPVLREAQWDAAQSIDNVYAICTIDCGEYDNIHPLDKRTPGERLANCALRQIYGMDRVPVHGPTVLASDATRTAAYACSSAMRTACISKAPRPAAATMISMASCDFGARAGTFRLRTGRFRRYVPPGDRRDFRGLRHR